MDAYEFGQLARTAVRLTLEGQARNGIPVSLLCQRARAGRSRLAQRCGQGWERFGDAVVRGIFAQERRGALYLEFAASSVRVGRTHGGLGTVKEANTRNRLHLLMSALAASDCHCPTFVTPLLTGTPHDHTSTQADAGRIAEFAEELGRRPPGTFAEHLEYALELEQGLRAAVRHVASNEKRAFDGSSITPQRLVQAFPRYVLIPPIAAGVPAAPYRGSAGLLFPGIDSAAVAILRSTNRRAVLHAGTPDRALVAAADPFGPVLLPQAEAFGIARTWGVQYLWAPEQEMLIRQSVGRGAHTDAWRLVGFPEDDLPMAVSLVERHEQVDWSDDCLVRFERDCGPGRLKARSAAICSVCRAVLVAANAAIVAADRRAQARAARG